MAARTTRSYRSNRRRTQIITRCRFLVDGATTETEKWITGLALVLLTSASLFLAPDFIDLWKSSHPNTHDRIRHAITGLNLESQGSRDYLYLLASMHFRKFLEQKNILLPQVVEDTPEDLFYRLLDQCDDARARRGEVERVG